MSGASHLEGRVALLAEHGELQAVLLGGVISGRVEAWSADGRRHSVAPQRLYYVGEGTVSTKEGLPAYWAQVEERALALDLESAWSATEPRPGIGSATVSRIAMAGGLRDEPASRDAVVLAIFRNSLWFKIRRQAVERVPAATVERRLAEREVARLEARQMELASSEFEESLRGRGSEPGTQSDEVQSALHTWTGRMEDVAVHGRDSPHHDAAMALLERIGRRRTGDPALRCFELLTLLGIFSPDENLRVRRARIRTAFEPELLEAARELAAATPDQVEPVDCTGLSTVAIDDPKTTEVDDAFAYDGDRLLVFISDVAAHVPLGSIVQAEAAARVSTVYLPEERYPMLPMVLGEEAVSLMPGTDRPALAFAATFTEEGEVDAFEIFEATCRVDRRATYDEVDAILADPDEAAVLPAEIVGLIRRAHAQMLAHEAARHSHGALSFPRI